MDEKPKPEPDDKEQSKRFEETARLLETDESGTAFEKSMEIIKTQLPSRSDRK